MRARRTTHVVVGLVALLGTATPALAARRTPPSCNLIRDPRGDAKGPQVPLGGADPAIDLVTADIATNATRLTAEIRVVGDVGTSSNSSPYGRYYVVHFSVGNHDFEAYADLDIATPGYGVREIGQPVGSDKGTGSATGHVIRITVPLSALRGHGATVRSGSPFTALAALAERASPVGNDIADEAFSEKTYRAGTRSCVKIGS